MIFLSSASENRSGVDPLIGDPNSIMDNDTVHVGYMPTLESRTADNVAAVEVNPDIVLKRLMEL